MQRLLPVIPNHKIVGRIAGINLTEFRTALSARPDVQHWFDLHPYYVCFQWAVDSCMKHAIGRGESNITFVHETNDYSTEALRWFEILQRRHSKSIAATIRFGTKEDYVPLQCADVLAYEGNHYLRNTLRPVRKPMQMLDPSGTLIRKRMLDPPAIAKAVAILIRVYDDGGLAKKCA